MFSHFKNAVCLTDEAIAIRGHWEQLTKRVTGSDVWKVFPDTEPKKVKLETYENMLPRFAYYIPVTQPIRRLLESDLWKSSFVQTNPDHLCDISDGQNLKS